MPGRISELPDAGALTGDELVEVTSDPAGTPVSERTTVGAIVADRETPAGAQEKADAAQAASAAYTDTEVAGEAATRANADTALDGRVDAVEATLPAKADLVDGAVPAGQLPPITLVIEDTATGLYRVVLGGGITETPPDSGLYTVASGGSITPDPADPGLYLIGA